MRCCLSLWSPVRDRVTDAGAGPRCSNLIRRSIFYGIGYPYGVQGIGYPCVQLADRQSTSTRGQNPRCGNLISTDRQSTTTSGRAPSAATLSGDHSLQIGSPRPRGDRTPGAATLSALIGSPRPRAAEPQVRQPYQEIIAVLLYGLPFAIGLQTRGQAPGAATLSGDPYFMGLDTHIDAIHGISTIS